MTPQFIITVEMSSANFTKELFCSHHSSLIHAHAEIDGCRGDNRVRMHEYDFIRGNVAAEVKR